MSCRLQHRKVILLALAAIVSLSGCTPFRANEARVERIWPPEDDSDVDELSSKTTDSSRTRSRTSNSHQAARRTRAASTSASADLAPPTDAQPVADTRLTAAQQQQLSAQLQAMTLPSSYPHVPGTANAPTEKTDAAAAALASYITEDSAPAEGESAETTTSSSPSETTAAVPDAAATAASAPATSTSPATTQPAAATASPATSTEAVAAPTTSSSETTPAAPTEVPASTPAQPTTNSTNSNNSNNSPADSAEGTAEPEASSPTVNTAPTTEEQAHWRTHLQEAVAGIERELNSDELSADDRTRLEGTLRLLYVADNRREDAAKPISSLDSDQQEFWKLSLAAFVELLDPNGPPVDGRRAKLALRHFRDAIHHLAAASSLDVRNLALCQRVDSFGSYKEFEPYRFRPEQEVILYVEVGNFAVEQKDGGYETELQGSYQILDGSGRRVADYDLMLDKQICKNIRTDYFLPYVISMPKNLAAGQYRIQVTIEDKKGGKFGQTPAVDFKLDG